LRRDRSRGSSPAPARKQFPRKRPRDTSAPAIARLLDRQDWSRIRDLIARSGAAPTSLGQLRDFCSRVIEWNRTVSNLISRNDEGRIVARHLAESLEHAAWLGETGCRNWVDFGSGAGFPAIPLAIVGVGSGWTLVESRRIKSLFLRKTLESMSMDGAMKVVNARLESLAEEGGGFDGFTARAAGNLTETLAHAAKLVNPGGSAFLWKGSRWTAELNQGRSWERQWTHTEHRPLPDSNVVLIKFLRQSV
jgi:16S rRNA (guanine527-N7)-methyltransferase